MDAVGRDVEDPSENHDDGKAQNHEHHQELESPFGRKGGQDDLTELQHHESDRRVTHGHAEDVATPQLRNEARQLGRLLNHDLQPINPVYRRGLFYSQHRSALILLQGYSNPQPEDEGWGEGVTRTPSPPNQ